jgi:hypothetical protein
MALHSGRVEHDTPVYDTIRVSVSARVKYIV